ncbi:hypothetical protein ACIRQF_30805 [Streptomyces sp. NPDC101191]|uniref:hypothetical protein n=1 Tax=Streptomyces sp. NPDC101191 TaxID=3366126 RepID=UPI0038003909
MPDLALCLPHRQHTALQAPVLAELAFKGVDFHNTGTTQAWYDGMANPGLGQPQPPAQLTSSDLHHTGL